MIVLKNLVKKKDHDLPPQTSLNCLAIKLRLGLLGPLCKNIKFFVLAEESVDKTFWKSLGGDEVAKHSINKM